MDSALLIAPFFSTDRAFDRSWMYIEAELVPDQVGEVARPDRLAGREARLDEGQGLALALVRPSRTSFFGYEPSDARAFEVRLRLIEGRARYAEVVGHVRNRRFLDGDPPKHFVFHLDDISRVEESVLPELRIADLGGGRVQRAVLGKLSSVICLLAPHQALAGAAATNCRRDVEEAARRISYELGYDPGQPQESAVAMGSPLDKGPGRAGRGAAASMPDRT